LLLVLFVSLWSRADAILDPWWTLVAAFVALAKTTAQTAAVATTTPRATRRPRDRRIQNSFRIGTDREIGPPLRHILEGQARAVNRTNG
jgi:hypothetical protein